MKPRKMRGRVQQSYVLQFEWNFEGEHAKDKCFATRSEHHVENPVHGVENLVGSSIWRAGSRRGRKKSVQHRRTPLRPRAAICLVRPRFTFTSRSITPVLCA